MNTSEKPPSIPPEIPKRGAGFRWRSSQVIAAGFVASMFLVFTALIPLSPIEIWGDLKHGQWMLQERGLPDRELFSLFVDHEQPYGNSRWLAQVVFYLVYHLGEVMAGGDELSRTAAGVEMLRSLHGLLVALQVGFVMLALKRQARTGPLVIAGGVLLVLLTLDTNRVAAAQRFGEVGFAFLLWWLSGPRLSRLSWLVLPLLFVLWANGHESFMVGLMLLSVFWLGRMIERGWSRLAGQTIDWRHDTWLVQGSAGLLLAPLAAGLLNPQGMGIYAYVWNMKENPLAATDPNWQPLNFEGPGKEAWLFLATLILLALSQLASPRPVPLAHLLVLLVFAVLALYQKRLLIWWMMLVPWFAVLLWRYTAALAPRFWLRCRGRASFRKAVLGAALLLAAGACAGWWHLRVVLGQAPLTGSVTPATLWPLARSLKEGEGLPTLADAVKDYPQQRFQGRMFVEPTLAGFLVWSLPLKAPVLVYAQAQQYPEVDWEHQITVLTGSPGWPAVLARYGVNLIAIDPQLHPELAEAVRKDRHWQIVQDGGELPTWAPWLRGRQEQVLIAVRRQPLLNAAQETQP